MTPEQRAGFRRILVIAISIGAIFYILRVIEGLRTPWSLWQSEWRQDEERTTTRVGRFKDQTACIKEQRKRLDEDLKLERDSEKILGKSFGQFSMVHILSGRTVFGFGQPLVARDASIPSSVFKAIDEDADLSPTDKEWAKKEALLPEIESSVTYLCTPTAVRLYWPFYSPDGRLVASSDLADEGRRVLATTASKMLTERESSSEAR